MSARLSVQRWWLLIIIIILLPVEAMPPPRRITLDEPVERLGKFITRLIVTVGVVSCFAGPLMALTCFNGPQADSCAPFCAITIMGAFIVAGGICTRGLPEAKLIALRKVAKWIKRNPQPLVDEYIARLAEKMVVHTNVYARVASMLSERERIIKQGRPFLPKGSSYNLLQEVSDLSQRSLIKGPPIPPEIMSYICQLGAAELRGLERDAKIPLTVSDLETLLQVRGEITGLAADKNPAHVHDDRFYCKGIVEIEGIPICNALTDAYVRLKFPESMCAEGLLLL